MNIEKKL